MRLFAIALAAVAAAWTTTGGTSVLSGQSAVPPCEALAASRPSGRPSKAAPGAPRNLRIVPASFNASFNAASTARSTLPAAASDTSAHAYFVALASRDDCFAAYSLRQAAQVATYAPKKLPADRDPQLFYLYPNDPDPRKQDAMKILIQEGESSVFGTFTVPVGPSRGQSLLFTFDLWFGKEFNFENTRLDMHKEAPIAFHTSGESGWVGMRMNYRLARQFEHNQPPGGPYVAFPFAQVLGKGGVVKTPGTWMSGMSGYEKVRLPANAPNNERRDYGNEAIAPVENEFGLAGERWTRYWHYFERRPAEDWVSDVDKDAFRGQSMNAYAWSMWAADTERGPVRILNERIIGINASEAGQISIARFTFGAGNAGRETEGKVGRGDLVGYTRNWVVLHGTSKANVLALLQKPVH
jgi:hypothetical protein